MYPVQGFTMLRFLRWLTAIHPEIQTIEGRSTKDLLRLVDEFEGGKLQGNEMLIRKWEAGFNFLLNTDRDWVGYGEARSVAQNLGSRFAGIRRIRRRSPYGSTRRDPFERYRTVPLHAAFLYSSEDSTLASYIQDNWHALHRMSADFCDIHPSLEQLSGSEDAYIALNIIIPENYRKVQLSRLPGVIFWDNSEHEYISFRGWDSDGITNGLRFIFEHIWRDPSIASVAVAEAGVRRFVSEQDHSGAGPVFNQYVNGGTAAQAQKLTQNVGIQPEQLVNLFDQLRHLAPQLPSDVRDEFLNDIEVLEDSDQHPRQRLSAGQRIMDALTSGGSQVAGQAIIAGLERLGGLISGG